jgi:hypothetical protein
MRRIATTAFACLLFVTFIGLRIHGREHDRAWHEPGSPPTSAPAPARSLHVSGCGAPAAVTVLDAGSTPRRTLRFRLVPGRERVRLDSTTSIEPKLDAPRSLVEATSTSTRLAATIDVQRATASASRQEVVWRFVRAVAERDGLAGGDPFRRTTIRWSRRDDGAASVEGTEDARATSLRAAGLTGTAPLLPRAPIGAGARWRRSSCIDDRGVTVRTDASFTLERVAGDRVDITGRYRLRLDDGAGESGRGSGAETLRLALDHALPVDQRLRLRIESPHAVTATAVTVVKDG